MNKSFNYRILPEYELIIESYKGNLSISDILEFKNLGAEDPDWKEHYNVLGDFTNAYDKIDVDIENIKDESYDSAQKYIKRHKAAILTNSPDQVVGSILMKFNLPSQALVQVEVFSTVERALSWLGINFDEFDKIKRILEQLSSE